MRHASTTVTGPAGRRLVAWAAAASVLLTALVCAPARAALDPDHPTAHDPIGRGPHVTATATGIRARGWAADPDALQQNVLVYAILDGRSVPARTTTSLPNPGVQKADATGPTPGYDLDVPVPGGRHTVCIVARNVGPGVSTVLGCLATPFGTRLTAAQLAGHSPTGAITGYTAAASSVRYSGWATDPDYVNRRLLAVLYVDGKPAGTVLTQPYGNPAAKPAPAGKNAKFDIVVPAVTGTHVGCVWIVNVGFGSNHFLGCQAVDTRHGAGTGTVAQPAVNKKVMATALKHRGADYVWGATGPKVFDCSGLVVYSYAQQRVTLPRVSEAQALAARLIPAARAVPGDLVFFHDSEGDVYHVGLYAKPGVDFAAIDEQEGVNYQSIWDPTSVTYGSFTHT